MVAVRYHAIPIVNQQTGYPLLEARGAVGYIVADGTTLAQAQAGVGVLHLSQDKAGTITIPQPITITPGGFVPTHWNQDGLEDALFVPLSGTWSTPISSNQGMRDAARDAAGDAAVSADAAVVAARNAAEAAASAKAPTDAAVAGALGTQGSATQTQAIDLIKKTAPNSGGGTALTSWANQVATLPDIPSTFAPRIGTGPTDAAAGNDSRLANQRVPIDGSVTDAKVATPTPTLPGISLDKTRDGSDRLAMTKSERDKLAGLGNSGPSATRVDYVRKVNGVWGPRPTADPTVLVFWMGANPAPAIVPSGTGGMLDNVDVRLVTP